MPLSHTTRLSLFTINPLTKAITRNEPIRRKSTDFCTVQKARNSNITSTVSSEMVVKGLIVLFPQNRSLTKPVHVASQKPMKKRRCIKNRFSNLITVGSLYR